MTTLVLTLASIVILLVSLCINQARSEAALEERRAEYLRRAKAQRDRIERLGAQRRGDAK